MSWRACKRASAMVLLAGAVALSGCSIQPNDHTLPGQAGVGGDGYTVTVHFNQVENLVPNSTVQMDNVIVGTVAGVEVKNWQATLKLRLKKSVRVPADATFSIGQKTLLGAQYVDIEPTAAHPGSAAVSPARATSGHAYLENGDVVGVRQTGAYPATEQVLGAAALLLNNGGLSQISTITRELSTAFRHRTPNVRGLIRKTNQLLAVLDRDKQTIVDTLDSLDSLSKEAAGKRKVIASAIDRITPGLATLNKERDNLVRAVTTTGKLSTKAADVVQLDQKALLANLEALQPILGNLGKVADSLPDALKIAFTIPFPAMTTTNAVRGDYANLFANLDLRLPGLAQAFLGGGLPTSRQATDPITGPLGLGRAQPKRPGQASPPTPSKAPKAPKAHRPSSGTRPTPSPTPTSDTSSGSCLLGLIGDC